MASEDHHAGVEIMEDHRADSKIVDDDQDADAEVVDDRRAGAEIVYGPEECHQFSKDILEEMGFPKGVLPLQDLVECGRVRETGFVWLKQKEHCEHFFEAVNTLASFATEVTAYVEKCKMREMTGIMSRQWFLWVPITEMIREDPASMNIDFKTPIGLGLSFPVTAFMTEEEKQKYLENGDGNESTCEGDEALDD